MVNDSACNIPCIGNTQQMCGGDAFNSIYTGNCCAHRYILIIHLLALPHITVSCSKNSPAKVRIQKIITL